MYIEPVFFTLEGRESVRADGQCGLASCDPQCASSIEWTGVDHCITGDPSNARVSHLTRFLEKQPKDNRRSFDSGCERDQVTPSRNSYGRALRFVDAAARHGVSPRKQGLALILPIVHTTTRPESSTSAGLRTIGVTIRAIALTAGCLS